MGSRILARARIRFREDLAGARKLRNGRLSFRCFYHFAFAPAATGFGNSRKLSYSYGFFAWLSVHHAVKPRRSGRPHLAAVKRPKYHILYSSRRGFSGQAVSSLICRLPRFASIIFWGRIMPGGEKRVSCSRGWKPLGPGPFLVYRGSPGIRQLLGRSKTIWSRPLWEPTPTISPRLLMANAWINSQPP